MMLRVLKQLRDTVRINYVNHSRRAKKHWFKATMAKTDEPRYPQYLVLLKDVEATRLILIEALETLKK